MIRGLTVLTTPADSLGYLADPPMPHPFKDWSLHVSLGGPSAVRKDMRAVVQMGVCPAICRDSENALKSPLLAAEKPSNRSVGATARTPTC